MAQPHTPRTPNSPTSPTSPHAHPCQTFGNVSRSGFMARIAGLAIGLAATVLVGCQSQEFHAGEQSLKDAVIASTKRELAESQRYPAPRATTREDRTPELNIKPEFRTELEKMAGPQAYDPSKFPVADDLNGQPTTTVLISLEKVVRSTAEYNLAVQFARLGPAISQAQIVAAEAAFDWTIFASASQTFVDSPQLQSSTSGFSFGSPFNQQNSTGSQLGVRRNLITGGRFTLQQDLNYLDNRTPGLSVNPDPSSALSVTAQFDQPLLKGFGSEVATAEIKLARNAERNAIASLKRDLLRQITDAEKTYWQLVQTHRDLLILQRLLQRGIEVRDQLKARQALDATPAVIAEATARVEARRADVLRAQTVLRQLSDRLKTLMNDPELVVGSEAMLVPADDAVDQPITFSLYESIMAGIAQRPEVTQSILSIDDQSVRQQVAMNARLPQLDLRLQTKFSALESSAGNSYSNVFNGQFIDYLVGLIFERPIGNRKAEADLRRAKLQRMQAVIAYRNTVQTVVKDVKDAMDRMQLNYRLISQTRTGRIASSEALRTFLVEKNLTKGYTVDRLNTEFSRQESLAGAERAENQALAEYNQSIADYYLATGQTLDRNNIKFTIPDSPSIDK